MRENQIARHWCILLTLDAKRHGVTVKELAELTGCTERTTYRDLDALDEAGFPLMTAKTPEGIKHLFREEYKLRLKLNFSPMELMALNLVSATHNFLEGTVFHDALESARKKVRATLNDQHIEYADAIQDMFGTTFRPVRDYGKHRKLIEAITQSLLERRRMKVTYWTPSRQKETKRTIEPYRLWYVNGALYLVAYCHVRKGVRTFLIDRIRKWELTDNNYEIPKDFDFEKYSTSGFKVLGGAKEQEVVVRVHPILKPQITEQTWHPTQKVEELTDGWLRVSFKLGALDEVKTWVQGYAPYIIVEKPRELIEDIVGAFKDSLNFIKSDQ